MRFVIAPDSFKGSLSACRAAEAMEAAVEAIFPRSQVCALPVADGGEGTVDALVRAVGGQLVPLRASDPLCRSVDAFYGRLRDGRAAVELACASGLPRLSPHEKNPLRTSSRGTGEIMLQALKDGAEELLVGLGGSATNDGGMGMLTALGARFYDENGGQLFGCGADLIRVRRADVSGLHPLVKRARIIGICDVKNPLLGKNGATRIYGPQKGASADMLMELEAGMANYARVLEGELGRDISAFPGAGAAGGAGAALGGVLGAQIRSGIHVVLDLSHFDDACRQANLVITGEGRIDSTSIACGKVIGGIAERCARLQKPLLVVAGSVGPGAEKLYEACASGIMASVNAPMGEEEAMGNAYSLLRNATARALRMIRLGMEL